MFTNAPVDIEPLEFEYKYDRTGRKYIVAKRKPMTVQTYIPHNQSTMKMNGNGERTRKFVLKHPASTMIFTIFHTPSGQPEEGKVEQFVRDQSHLPPVDMRLTPKFEWTIDGKDHEFYSYQRYAIPLLKSLWIALKNAGYEEKQNEL